MSRFDRFRTEQIRTERQFFNERNCSQRDTKPENLTCHRLSLVIRLYNQIKDIWLAFCAVYIVRKRHEGQMIHFLETFLPHKIESK